MNRIDPTAAPSPGQGGWTPASLTPLIGACVVGAVTGLGAALATPGQDWKSLLGAALVGCGTGLAGFLGIRSAGPRR